VGRRKSIDASVAALEAVYREHHRRVRWLLRARGVGDEGLDDAMQDVFIAIHRRLPERDPEVPLSAWVASIACNTAFSHRRTHARRAAREQLGLEATPSLDPAQELERRDAWLRLRDFLDALLPAQREVFVMADVMGMTMPEIAEASPAPLATLYSRLRLARTRFAARFDAPLDDTLLQRARAQGEPTAREHGRSWTRLVLALPGAGTTMGAPLVVAATLGVLGLGALAVVTTRPHAADGDGARVTSTETTRVDRPIAARAGAAVPPSPPSPTAPIAPPIAAPAVEFDPRPATRAPPRSVPRPTVDNDEIARALIVLDAAQLAIRNGDPAAALAAIDTDYARLARGPMARELARIERRAACALGQRGRATRAHAVLVGSEAARAADACADE